MKFTLLLLFAALVRADTVPSLVWDGDPIVEFSSGTFAFPTATPDGWSIGADCNTDSTSCGFSFFIVRQFTVTSPGTFLFSGSGTNNALADNCTPVFCQPTSFVSVHYSMGGIGSYVSFSGSGSATSPLPEVSLVLMGSDSDVLGLGLGDYFLGETYNGVVQGSGDVSLEFLGSFSLHYATRIPGGLKADKP